MSNSYLSLLLLSGVGSRQSGLRSGGTSGPGGSLDAEQVLWASLPCANLSGAGGTGDLLDAEQVRWAPLSFASLSGSGGTGHILDAEQVPDPVGSGANVSR